MPSVKKRIRQKQPEEVDAPAEQLRSPDPKKAKADEKARRRRSAAATPYTHTADPEECRYQGFGQVAQEAEL
jgi:hypothetical protein